MFQKHPEDKCDFILVWDLLRELKLDIHYSTSKIFWEDNTVDTVPSGYWTKTNIKQMAKTWNSSWKPIHELHATQISPAEYKATEITEVVQQ